MNGVWSDWGSWSLCSDAAVSCDSSSSVYRRIRTCDNPKPFGGGDCTGDSSMEVSLGNDGCLISSLNEIYLFDLIF